MGTWIEMRAGISRGKNAPVVPYVGTWIEISRLRFRLPGVTSRSLRGNVDRNSAMRLTAVTTLFCRSLRGNVDRNTIGFCKHFRWRGRSLRGNVDRNIMSTDGFPSKAVVPYVGTWIEIFSSAYCTSGELCRSLRGNVDRNLLEQSCISQPFCRSLRGNVDRNVSTLGHAFTSTSRSLRGNVDRNKQQENHLSGCQGRSLRGNVDRNFFHR